MNPTTITSRVAAGLVAAVAGFASYRHIYDVANESGEHKSVSAVLPLAIDGLILVATLAMLDDKRNNRRPRLSARLALVFGVAATLAANVASAAPNVQARLVAAVPAVSFLLAVEVLARKGKLLRTEEPVTVVELLDDDPDWIEAVTEATGHRQDYAAPIGPQPVPVSTPAVPVDDKPAVKRARPKSLTSAERVAKAVAKNPDATPAEIAAKLGLSERTVQRYMPRPADDTVTTATGPDAAETAPEPATVERINGHQPELVDAPV